MKERERQTDRQTDRDRERDREKTIDIHLRHKGIQ